MLLKGEMRVWESVERSGCTRSQKPWLSTIERGHAPHEWVTVSGKTLREFPGVKFCADSIAYKSSSDETINRSSVCIRMQKDHMRTLNIL